MVGVGGLEPPIALSWRERFLREALQQRVRRCQNDSFDGIDTSSRLILAVGKTLIVVRQILNLTRNKEGLTLPAI